jgi:hypothetical protein
MQGFFYLLLLHTLPTYRARPMANEPFVHARLVESVGAIRQSPRRFTGYNILQADSAREVFTKRVPCLVSDHIVW